ncbi:MAG: endonuclease/exonuclease/phosphatase family protein [Verrucomicrobiae bacterium]|nr:endonuclease/exonuclease/phosphatase family protein [Verrucomicrobiae bacterium]MCX7721859.1 endonuclease/exonuclease/phosphatase family protein [Verrucomicrobiae bacterium]MDW7979495.1 endonuclease/exonuclease/phosphatase family protein [Verrucomicrobiales bacterium]
MKFLRCALGFGATVLWLQVAVAADVFRVATYNLENYLLQPAGSRRAKSEESRAAVHAIIKAINADVLALQEVGGPEALQELRRALKAEGLDYPFWELVVGYDTNINLAILSRFPFTARRAHTNDSYLLAGRRFSVRRGFAEVAVKVNENYSFTLINAHLKSRVPVPEADHAEMRFEEARILRRKVEAAMASNPMTNLIVLGDLNDTKDSRPLRVLIGQGRSRLIDTRPAESSPPGADGTTATGQLGGVTWTYFYDREDSYQRVDYILLTPGMAREWVPHQSYVLSVSNWIVASDHRPVVAAFIARD